MEINYREIADVAVAYAKANQIVLDYSKMSIGRVDDILGNYHENLAQYDGEEGEDTLWNIAVHFGIYLGETMAAAGLKEKGFYWYMDDGIPILRNDANMEISPVTKAHKRILYGPDEDLETFSNVVFSAAEGNLPTEHVHRGVDVELASGRELVNVPYRDMDPLIALVADGKEQHMIMESHDGFLQFYGVHDQFVMEIRMNLQNNDFRTYSIIDREKEHMTDRIPLVTPYGRFTPMNREVIPLELVKTVIKKYYENLMESDLLKEIPYIETTLETKKYMGI